MKSLLLADDTPLPTSSSAASVSVASGKSASSALQGDVTVSCAESAVVNGHLC